ncbi:MAG: serine--tRNA ligase [Candidatus Niyogibacteria bacterium CG10_big_fil_rev_8_21_14_0_10_42_19]|uniref:Serine--tRNA ligase n=1 Tax=Candidatus Niyogibacteria bacterium CG10_big_fil_rev_8_21_14_0_10_42_19 TaxID=1974725 RepID=A0A2H0TFX2_9BACT|nr:MAG: serine--tRNA ligase [Candidatus Niyogibacteria bacterium CG10_big_fil_rev_8_21_14_0_10_42_19]
MLDIKFIRENPDLIREASRKKKMPFDISKLLETEEKRRSLLSEIEELRGKQNKASETVVNLKTDYEKELAFRSLREIKDTISSKEQQFKKIIEDWQKLMYDVPNIPDPSVPEGADDDENEVIRTGGEIPKFDFPIKNHDQILKDLGLADLERGVKVSGFRGYFLKKEAVLLSMGLWQFAIDTVSKKGYEPVMAPSLVRDFALYGSGHFPQLQDDVYKTQEETYLAGTAEIPMMGYYSGEILLEEDLPKKFVAFSPCFRREAGSYGRDTKGIYRLHEFFKVEQLILSKSDHLVSVELHEELTANAEELVKTLGLPYRIVTVCSGGMGRAQVKTYDIEVWIPSENKYRESHSSSYYHDFQTRRLNIRYRDKDGRMNFCHSLNNTAIATPRILISILENYQQKDGSILIPDALKKYVEKEVIEPRTTKK